MMFVRLIIICLLSKHKRNGNRIYRAQMTRMEKQKQKQKRNENEMRSNEKNTHNYVSFVFLNSLLVRPSHPRLSPATLSQLHELFVFDNFVSNKMNFIPLTEWLLVSNTT